jgi:TonB-dependent receptor
MADVGSAGQDLRKEKHTMRKLLIWIFAVITSDATFGQTTPITLVKGTIEDAALHTVLEGASVRVLGSTEGTVADQNGQFLLYVPAGNRNLVVSFLGYRDTTVSVSVNGSQSTNLRIGLSSSSAQLNSVLITGYLQGQARALSQQKNADNIRNIVSSDQIGRFPDPNAAEALQRVPGVNIERDQGEGRYVLVRGLAPQFTNINVNGEQIPSPEADVRFVALDAIPSDQLASIEVSKSLTPDMDGDAVGGSVNLITRTAQTGRTNISGSLAGGYNNLIQKPNIQGQLQLDKRFGKNERLGILVNGNYYHNHLASDNWEQSPSDAEVELRDYELVRTRTGVSTTIDYRFNNRNELYLRTLYSRFTDREWRRRYVFIPEDEEIEKLTKDRFEAQTIATINFGGRHQFSKFYLNYEGQYSEGRQNTPYDYEISFLAGIPSSLSFPDPKFPRIEAPNFNNNSDYEFDEASFGNTLAKDRNITGKFEIGVPYQLARSSGLLKFGAKYRSKKKSYDITSDIYESEGGVPALDEFDEDPVKDEFLDNRYVLGRPLSVGLFNRFFNANPALFELDVESKSIDEALEGFQGTEDVTAAFVMARHQFKKLLVVGGVRYERTKVNYNSKDVIIDASGDLESILPISGSSTYDFVLPQFQIRYELNPFTNLRLAGTYSYARPNFSEIIPSQEINREDNLATVGNAALRPTGALNLDAMIEHYFGNVGIASIGVFHKRLDDFIYRRVLFDSPYPLSGTPIIDEIDVIQSQNGDVANLTGVEAAFQRKLDFLPGIFRKFSVYANYTYTHSKARIQSRNASADKPDEQEELRLPGQATSVGNAAIAFESKKFVVRLAANFNGEYLSEVGGEPAEDLYVKSRMQLDLNTSFTISERLRVFAEFLNLTNQPFETYLGTKSVLSQREFYSWWSRVGVKFKF